MGASRERKKRLEAKEAGVTPVNKRDAEEAKKNKQFKTAAIIILVVVVVCAAVIFVLRSDFFYQNATAVKVNDDNYSISEYNYFRALKVIEYEGYFGDLEGMSDLITTDAVNKATIDEMAKTTMYHELAMKNGFELTEDLEAQIEENMKTLESYASMMGMTIDAYTEQVYGKGVTVEKFKEYATKNAISKAYQEHIYDGFEYSAEELEENYVADEDDVFGYYLYTFYNSAQEDEENAAEITKGLADEFASKVDSIEDFQKLAVEYSTGYNKIMYERDPEAAFAHNAGDSVNDAYVEWVVDESRKEGDIEVFTDDIASYVVYYVDRNDNNYNPVSVRMIVFDADISYSDYESDEEYLDAYEADYDSVVKSAESVVEQWKEGEMTEESFAKLANTYNTSGITDDGGLMEIMLRDSYDKAINDWCYDSARKAGDVEVIKTPTSAYVIYYVGEYSQTYREYTVDRDLRAEDFNAWEEEKLTAYTGKEGPFIGFGNK